jgi:hypothetical protein
MGVGGNVGQGSTDNTTDTKNTGTSYGTWGQNHDNQSTINYLDPDAIARQKAAYDEAIGEATGHAGESYGSASKFYGGLLGSQGYDDKTKQAASEIGNLAANEKLDEAKAAAERHAAATGNDAGSVAALTQAYGNAAQDTAQRANENQLKFFQEQQRQRELGGAGMERLLGISQAAQLGLLGQQQGLNTLRSGQTDTGTSAGTSGNTTTNEGQTHQLGSYKNQSTGAEAKDLGSSFGDILKKLFGPGSTTKPTGDTKGGGSPGGGTSPGSKTPGNPNGDPNLNPDGTTKGEADHNGLHPGDDGYGEIEPGDSVDADGNHPGDPGYNPYSDPTNELYDPSWTGEGSSPGDSVDANGNSPGDPDYDPSTDPTNPDYDPFGGGDGGDDGGGMYDPSAWEWGD